MVTLLTIVATLTAQRKKTKRMNHKVVLNDKDIDRCISGLETIIDEYNLEETDLVKFRALIKKLENAKK